MAMTTLQAAEYVQDVVEGRELDIRDQHDKVWWDQIIHTMMRGQHRKAVVMTPQQLALWRRYSNAPAGNHILGARIRTSA